MGLTGELLGTGAGAAGAARAAAELLGPFCTFCAVAKTLPIYLDLRFV